MWRLMKIGYTSLEVGRAMGYSHATVLHGSRKVTDMLSINDPVMVQLTKMVDVL
jgi:chromosomal replication initiation ATPase DnaA